MTFELSDSHWEVVRHHLPSKQVRSKGGRPRADDRSCLNGIVWVLRTGAQWSQMPRKYPHYSTCWRRLREWQGVGFFDSIWKDVLVNLNGHNMIDWGEAFADGSFASAKKGGEKVGKTKRGKGTKLMMITDGTGIPLSLTLESASPAEVTLIESTLSKISIGAKNRRGRPRKRPQRLIADKAYDSNRLRKNLKSKGIVPIFPARSNNSIATDQDGRPMRRYKKRWKVERTFAWILAFRRLTVRWDRLASSYEAFIKLACAIISMRKLPS
jgi:transposase